MISKYGPSLSKAVGPVDPSFLVVKKSHFDEKYSSYSESTILKQPLKKDKTKILISNGSLMKVKRIAECSPWSILQYFLPALSYDWPFLSGHLRQVLLYNQQSIYIKCIQVSVSVCR